MRWGWWIVLMFQIGLLGGPLGEARQLLVVVTPGWGSDHGTLFYLEKRKGQWYIGEKRLPVMIGRNGLAPGDGLWVPDVREKAKQEGDGKAPAGLFALEEGFGSAGTFSWPWRVTDASLYCVDDASSALYNRIVDINQTGGGWKSAEVMQRPDGLYDRGIVVGHNRAHTPGNGSCVFLHIWRGRGMPTSGCTAMDKEGLERLIRWLDPEKKPLLLQLPIEEYRKVAPGWGLPLLTL